MKYMVSWETRQTASEDLQARGLQVFSKWSPSDGTTFLQFLGRSTGAAATRSWRPTTPP